jgi:hypothetical protein
MAVRPDRFLVAWEDLRGRQRRSRLVAWTYCVWATAALVTLLSPRAAVGSAIATFVWCVWTLAMFLPAETFGTARWAVRKLGRPWQRVRRSRGSRLWTYGVSSTTALAIALLPWLIDERGPAFWAGPFTIVALMAIAAQVYAQRGVEQFRCPACGDARGWSSAPLLHRRSRCRACQVAWGTRETDWVQPPPQSVCSCGVTLLRTGTKTCTLCEERSKQSVAHIGRDWALGLWRRFSSEVRSANVGSGVTRDRDHSRWLGALIGCTPLLVWVGSDVVAIFRGRLRHGPFAGAGVLAVGIFGALVAAMFAVRLLRLTLPARRARAPGAHGIRLVQSRQRVESVVASESSAEASSAALGEGAALLEAMAATEPDRSGSSGNDHSGS